VNPCEKSHHPIPPVWYVVSPCYQQHEYGYRVNLWAGNNTNCIQQKPPWEGSSSSANQEVPTLCGTQNLISVHRLLPWARWVNPFTTHVFKFRFRTGLQRAPRSFKWAFPFRFMDNILHALIVSPWILHALTVSSFLLDRPNNIS
jgi:hypothetical protein